MKKQEAYHLVLYRGKPHGFKGHIKFQFAEELNDQFAEIEHLFVKNKGTYIPYFIEEISFPNNQYCIVKLEDINDDSLKLTELYIDENDTELYIDIDENEEAYIGYTCEDVNYGILGPILRMDIMPAQEMAIIDYKGRELLIPFVDEFIAEIDDEKQTILFQLPDGFLEINE